MRIVHSGSSFGFQQHGDFSGITTSVTVTQGKPIKYNVGTFRKNSQGDISASWSGITVILAVDVFLCFKILSKNNRVWSSKNKI